MSTLYEELMELAIKLGHEADEIAPDRDENTVEFDEEMSEREADTLAECGRRIAEILNASPEADTEGSASSQHFIETGVRLPRDPNGVIRVAALNFLHGSDPDDFDLGELADALGVDRNEVEALG